MKTVTAQTTMCVPEPRPVIFRPISVLPESPFPVTTGMYVPMTAVILQEGVSIATTLHPVMTEMSVQGLIPVHREAVLVVIPLPVMTETAAPVTPVIR